MWCVELIKNKFPNGISCLSAEMTKLFLQIGVKLADESVRGTGSHLTCHFFFTGNDISDVLFSSL